MGITVLKNNAPWGPFTCAQIEEGLARGDYNLQYLAHAPGLKDWLPLGEVLHHVERSAILPPVPDSCGITPPIPAKPPTPPALPERVLPVSPTPPPIPPVVEKREIKPEAKLAAKPEVRLPAAPFIPRGIALLIDCAILFVPVAILFVLGTLAIEIPGAWGHIDHESRMQEWALLERNTRRLAWLVAVGFGWFYGAGLECSRWQATVGKRWMGIKVTDAQGGRLGFLRATGRYAAKYLSALSCFLGFIAALFSSRGLALHDRLAGTRVVKK